MPKACKNPVELEGARKAHMRDGAALSRFLAWFAREAPDGHLTEIEAAETLEGFRRATGCLRDLSFDSISGAGSDGAIVHYRVTRSSNRAINTGEVYLIDSGGQYPDGTTDVTRTVIVGVPTAEMKDRFTRVLKGHIAWRPRAFPTARPAPSSIPSRAAPCGTPVSITSTAPATAWEVISPCMKARKASPSGRSRKP